jgi:hypothetical protein
VWKVDDELHGGGDAGGVSDSCSSSFLDSSRLSPPPRAKNLEEEEDKVQLSASLLDSHQIQPSRREPEEEE